MDLTTITDDFVVALRPLRFAPPVTHVYNPLEYARESWDLYVRKFGRKRREIVFLGMNPGPFGMAQTGVPFGEISMVRDWMGIEAETGKPPNEHPKRPITGFGCTRSEVSGRRLWGWARDRFGAAEQFFDRFFVANFCPLVFMEASGRNFTPDKLPAGEKRELFKICDENLRQTVACLSPRLVVGIGEFARKRAEEALQDLDVQIGRVLHPSPASPKANRGWTTYAEEELAEYGVVLGGSD